MSELSTVAEMGLAFMERRTREYMRNGEAYDDAQMLSFKDYLKSRMIPLAMIEGEPADYRMFYSREMETGLAILLLVQLLGEERSQAMAGSC